MTNPSPNLPVPNPDSNLEQHAFSDLYDAGPDSCVIALGLIRATYSRRAVERVLKWLDTEVDVPVSDDMCVWLGLYVVPVGVLRAAAAEMTRIREASGQAVARGSQPALDFGEGA